MILCVILVCYMIIIIYLFLILYSDPPKFAVLRDILRWLDIPALTYLALDMLPSSHYMRLKKDITDLAQSDREFKSLSAKMALNPTSDRTKIAHLINAIAELNLGSNHAAGEEKKK